MKRLILNPKADRDLDHEAVYIAQQVGPDAALKFYDACDATYPEIGKIREFKNPQLSGIRVWALREFRSYLVFYRVVKNTVEILRIIHGRRDIETIFNEEFEP